MLPAGLIGPNDPQGLHLKNTIRNEYNLCLIFITGTGLQLSSKPIQLQLRFDTHVADTSILQYENAAIGVAP